MAIQPLQLQLAESIQALSGDQVKALILRWLMTSDASLIHLIDQLGALETAIELGEVDADGQFQPLSEASMIEHSLSALQHYQQTGIGIDHDRIQEWANSLNTTNKPQ
jgi:hypothetical protein